MRRPYLVRIAGLLMFLALLLHGGVQSSVTYTRNGDGTYTFHFIDSQGKVTTLRYSKAR